MMNQTVVRIYLLMLVSVLGVVFAVWPKIGPRAVWASILRLVAVVGLGVVVLVMAFHQPGQVEALQIDEKNVSVLEVFPGRIWSPIIWTHLSRTDGELQGQRGPETLDEKMQGETKVSRLRFVPRLSGQVERLRSEADVGAERYEGIGPVINQGRAAVTTNEYVILSAYEEIGDPSSMYLTRVDEDGRVQWRVSAHEMGIKEGQLQRALRLDSQHVVAVMKGVKMERTWLEQMTFSTHIIATKVNIETGLVSWSTAF